jgi:putative selenium metabolism protein SsnA
MNGGLVIRNGIVVTLGEPCRVLHDHAVVCEDGRITGIVPGGEAAGRPGRHLDACGGVIMPGFINAHMHFYSTLVRGLGKAEPSHDFVEVLEHLWWRLDRRLDLDDSRVSTLVALVDAVRHGTTTLIDHHASPGAVEGSLDALADAVSRVGLRACLCYEVSDRDGPEVARLGIEENTRFLERCREHPAPLLRGLFGLHASFTLSDSTLERAADVAAGLETGCHVHVAESAADQEHCLSEHGKRVVERFAERGVLGPQTVAAHGVFLEPQELELLADSGTALVHNPQSNMNNAVGVADVPAMADAGVLVGLGTDAMTVDLREELRAAVWSQRLAASDPSVGFGEAVGALTVGNPKIVTRLWPEGVGELREGFAADVVVLDYRPPTPFDASSFAGHLVFGMALAPVTATVVAGRVLMADQKLEIDIDEDALAAEARARAEALWARF